MKKIMILLSAIVVASVSLHAQHRKDSYFGVGVGYTSEGHIPLTLHYSYKFLYVGTSAALPMYNVLRGRDYSGIINWVTMPEDVIEEGVFYTPITLDLGYNIKDFTIGVGGGIAFRSEYTNYFDEIHSAYYIKTSEGPLGEFKGFVKYRFPTRKQNPAFRMYISTQYTIRTGIGATLGVEI